MKTAKIELPERPALERGDQVRVLEVGITPWVGTVNAVKPSSESGWWVDVYRDGVGVWSICLQTTTLEKLA
jgi:hypothetical protein